MKNGIAYVFAFFAVVSAGLTAVSLATVHWIDSETTSVSSGLWQICLGDTCVSFDTVVVYVDVIRAFLCLGIIAHVFTVVVCILVGMSKANPNLIPINFGCGGILVMVAMAVFTAKEPLSFGIAYGYSYILGWVSCGLNLIFAVASAVAIMRNAFGTRNN